MQHPYHSMNFLYGCFAAGLIVGMAAESLYGQTAPAPSSGTAPEPVNWTTQQDHQNMKEQLGIKVLRPGPSGRAGATNAANYDPANANPYPDLPDPLTLKNGEKVTSAEMWWKQRRPEIVEDFDREIYGRVPQSVPKVSWEVLTSFHENSGDIPVITKKLLGHVDNSSDPLIDVQLQLTLTTPANARGPVPVMMEFGLSPEVLAAFARRFRGAVPGASGNVGPTWQQQVLAHGWG